MRPETELLGPGHLYRDIADEKCCNANFKFITVLKKGKSVGNCVIPKFVLKMLLQIV